MVIKGIPIAGGAKVLALPPRMALLRAIGGGQELIGSQDSCCTALLPSRAWDAVLLLLLLLHCCTAAAVTPSWARDTALLLYCCCTAVLLLQRRLVDPVVGHLQKVSNGCEEARDTAGDAVSTRP